MTLRDEASTDAARILASTWGDIVPVDPVRIARTLGIRVLNAQLEPNVAAALIKKEGQDPSIVLNASDSANRKRFSCAHEIGHFVRRSDQPEQYEYIDFRDTLSATGEDPEERYANSFAASLLMPEKHVQRFSKEGFTDVEMAVRFNVSREAMTNRLKNLGLLQ